MSEYPPSVERDDDDWNVGTVKPSRGGPISLCHQLKSISTENGSNTARSTGAVDDPCASFGQATQLMVGPHGYGVPDFGGVRDRSLNFHHAPSKKQQACIPE